MRIDSTVDNEKVLTDPVNPKIAHSCKALEVGKSAGRREKLVMRKAIKMNPLRTPRAIFDETIGSLRDKKSVLVS